MERAEGPSVPIIERATSLDGWADVIRQRFIALQIAPHAAPDLAGQVRTRHVGHLQASAVASVPQTFIRTKKLASAGETELFALGLVERGTGHLEQDGRTCAVAGGSFALYETSRPFAWSMTGDWRLCVFTWPRESIALSEVDTQRLTAATVSKNSGVGRLLVPMLNSLLHADAGLSPAGAVRLAGEVAELSMIAASEARRGAGDAEPGHDRLREIQVFIEEHLTDPTLIPDRIAQHFYLSPRSLHRIFASHGLTVAAWIKHRRLEACRRALIAPGSRSVPVSEIASRYGFATPAFFSREFSAQYGMSPRTYRHQREA